MVDYNVQKDAMLHADGCDPITRVGLQHGDWAGVDGIKTSDGESAY